MLKEDFTQEILTIESSNNWALVLEGLKNRGVEKVGLIVSDALSGIDSAVSKVFPCSAHQLCVNHLKNSIIHASLRSERRAITDDLKKVFRKVLADDNIEKGWDRWLSFIDKWGKKYPRLKSYLSYDYGMRSMIYTNNWIENLNKKFRAVLHKRGVIPSMDSVINFLASVVIDYQVYKYHVNKFAYEPKFVYRNLSLILLLVSILYTHFFGHCQDISV